MKTSLHDYFSQLPDPRIRRNKKHLLIDIIVLRIIAVLCGAESWNSIELFGNSNVCPVGTVIPELLNLLDIEGCIITIDAMGTQKKIAETIIDKQADYILALKGNQGYLKEDVQNTFLRQQPDSIDETVEKGHGRIETRKCEVINKLDFLDEKEQWAGLKSLARVTASREINGKKTSEERLYISSVESDAKSFNSFIRQHWGVENALHWTLDVTFREDAQRKRNGHAASNYALVEKIALNLLKTEDSGDQLIMSAVSQAQNVANERKRKPFKEKRGIRFCDFRKSHHCDFCTML